MTPYDNTPTIPIHKVTLHGDTLSPFLFTIFVEPLLRWLSVVSRGYNRTRQSELTTSTYMPYDAPGYANDTNITRDTLANL